MSCTLWGGHVQDPQPGRCSTELADPESLARGSRSSVSLPYANCVPGQLKRAQLCAGAAGQLSPPATGCWTAADGSRRADVCHGRRIVSWVWMAESSRLHAGGTNPGHVTRASSTIPSAPVQPYVQGGFPRRQEGRPLRRAVGPRLYRGASRAARDRPNIIACADGGGPRARKRSAIGGKCLVSRRATIRRGTRRPAPADRSGFRRLQLRVRAHHRLPCAGAADYGIGLGIRCPRECLVEWRRRASRWRARRVLDHQCPPDPPGSADNEVLSINVADGDAPWRSPGTTSASAASGVMSEPCCGW